MKKVFPYKIVIRDIKVHKLPKIGLIVRRTPSPYVLVEGFKDSPNLEFKTSFKTKTSECEFSENIEIPFDQKSIPMIFNISVRHQFLGGVLKSDVLDPMRLYPIGSLQMDLSQFSSVENEIIVNKRCFDNKKQGSISFRITFEGFKKIEDIHLRMDQKDNQNQPHEEEEVEQEEEEEGEDLEWSGDLKQFDEDHGIWEILKVITKKNEDFMKLEKTLISRNSINIVLSTIRNNETREVFVPRGNMIHFYLFQTEMIKPKITTTGNEGKKLGIFRGEEEVRVVSKEKGERVSHNVIYGVEALEVGEIGFYVNDVGEESKEICSFTVVVT